MKTYQHVLLLPVLKNAEFDSNLNGKFYGKLVLF